MFPVPISLTKKKQEKNTEFAIISHSHGTLKVGRAGAALPGHGWPQIRGGPRPGLQAGRAVGREVKPWLVKLLPFLWLSYS